MAVQDKETKKIYVGVSWVCLGVGLSKSQKDTQVQNLQSDLVLSRGCLKFQAGVFDPNNSILAIELSFLPLWLEKISITPKMQEEKSELTERLVEYQLKAKDVLAEAFIYKTTRKKPVDLIFKQNMNIAKILSECTGVKSDIAFAEAIQRTEELSGEDLTRYN